MIRFFLFSFLFFSTSQSLYAQNNYTQNTNLQDSKTKENQSSLNLQQKGRVTVPEFKDRHFTPFRVKLFGYRSKRYSLWLGGLTLLAYSGDQREKARSLSDSSLLPERSDFAQAFLLGYVPLTVTFWQYQNDEDPDRYQSHLRAIVYTKLITEFLANNIAFQKKKDVNEQHHFPSVGAALVFASATSLNNAYGWRVGLLSYTLATIVSLQQLKEQNYWISDLVSGASLGFLIGRAAYYDLEVQSNTKEFKAESKIEILPFTQITTDEKISGLSFLIPFDL